MLTTAGVSLPPSSWHLLCQSQRVCPFCSWGPLVLVTLSFPKQCQAHKLFQTCEAHKLFQTCEAHKLFQTCAGLFQDHQQLNYKAVLCCLIYAVVLSVTTCGVYPCCVVLIMHAAVRLYIYLLFVCVWCAVCVSCAVCVVHVCMSLFWPQAEMAAGA